MTCLADTLLRADAAVVCGWWLSGHEGSGRWSASREMSAAMRQRRPHAAGESSVRSAVSVDGLHRIGGSSHVTTVKATDMQPDTGPGVCSTATRLGNCRTGSRSWRNCSTSPAAVTATSRPRHWRPLTWRPSASAGEFSGRTCGPSRTCRTYSSRNCARKSPGSTPLSRIRLARHRLPSPIPSYPR